MATSSIRSSVPGRTARTPFSGDFIAASLRQRAELVRDAEIRSRHEREKGRIRGNVITRPSGSKRCCVRDDSGSPRRHAALSVRSPRGYPPRGVFYLAKNSDSSHAGKPWANSKYTDKACSAVFLFRTDLPRKENAPFRLGWHGQQGGGSGERSIGGLEHLLF